MQSSDRLPGTLRRGLQLATRQAHIRIEQRMPFAAPHFDVASYRQLLAAFHGFYRPLEQRLAASARCLTALQWDQRVKLPLLTMDLLALGMTCGDIEALPICDRLPAVETPSRALGCLYVVEGSTLGGQVVQRLLFDSLGAAVADALAFFRSYGTEVGTRWRGFLVCLEALKDDKEAEEAKLTAVDTFRALENWLDERGVLR
jgi:heme oxygenase (biliverdin-IX-beta and delta-forming)